MAGANALSSAARKARESRIKAVSLAEDFCFEWDSEVADYKCSLAGRKMGSPLEFALNLGGVITARDSFGERFDKLVSQLDEEGKSLLTGEDDSAVIFEITEAIDKVFELSEGLDLEFSVSGQATGYLGDTHFSMSDTSFFIKRNWHYKYDRDPYVCSINNKKAADKQAAEDRLKDSYEAELRKVRDENRELDRKKAAELKRVLTDFKAENRKMIAKLDEEYAPKTEALRNEEEHIRGCISDAERELAAAGSFNLPAKIKISGQLKELRARKDDVGSRLNRLLSEQQSKTDRADYELVSNAGIVKRILELKYRHKPDPAKPPELLTERERMIQETEERVLEVLNDRMLDYDLISPDIPTKYRPYLYSALDDLEKRRVIAVSNTYGVKNYCGWSGEKADKIVADPSSFVITYDSVRKLRKREYDKACGKDIRLRIEIIHFYEKYEGQNLYTGRELVSPYIAARRDEASDTERDMIYEGFFRSYRTSENIYTCSLVEKTNWLLNEYSYFSQGIFEWKKTPSDEEELRNLARIPDRALRDEPPAPVSARATVPSAASAPAARQVPNVKSVKKVSASDVPPPPVPLDGLAKDVYALIAGNGGELDLNSVCIGFPDENRGRLKSVLFNLCGDKVLIKRNTPSGDVYKLR